jgi:hypothetical protein
LDAYLDRHRRYATWEAMLRYKYLKTGSYGTEVIKPSLGGNIQQVRRFWKLCVIRLPLEPVVWFVYHYFVCLGFVEGKRGLWACLLRAAYILHVRAKLYELTLREERNRGFRAVAGRRGVLEERSAESGMERSDALMKGT